MSTSGIGFGVNGHLDGRSVAGQTDTSVHYLLTFADGVTSDETITINSGQKYTPTAAVMRDLGRLGGPDAFFSGKMQR